MYNESLEKQNNVVRPTIILLVALQCVLVIVIAVSVYFQSYLIKSNILESNLDSVLAQSKNNENKLSNSFNLLRMFLLNVNIDDGLGGGKINFDQARLDDQLNDILYKLVFVRSLSLIDKNGRVLYSTTTENNGLNIDVNHYMPVNANSIVGALRFGRTLYSRDFYDSQSVLESKALSQTQGGINDSGFLPVTMLLPGYSNFSVVAAINNDYFVNFSEASNSLVNMEYRLFLDDGSLIFSNNELDEIGFMYEDVDGFDAVLSSSKKGINENKIYSYLALSSYPFFIQNQTLKENVLHQWSQNTKKLVWIAVLIAGLLLCITISLTKRVYSVLLKHSQLYVKNEKTIKALRAQELENKKLLKAIEQSPTSIVITDLAGNIEYVNTEFYKATGYGPGEVIGSNIRMLSSGLTSQQVYNDLWGTIKNGGLWEGELINKRKDGSIFIERALLSPLTDFDGKVINYIGVKYDITQLKKYQENLELLAHYDPLTKLPNRALLQDRLEVEISKSKREGKMLAVCFVDLDGFKEVNDTYGHGAGDELLEVIAHRLKSNIREGDTAARLGGDEFVLLLGGIEDTKQYEGAAKRILNAIQKPISLSAAHVSVSGSMGITIYPHDYSEAEQLMRHADHAMYQAKQEGKNCFVVYKPDYN